MYNAKDSANMDWLHQVKSLSAWRYKAPLLSEITTARQVISYREGIVLRWQTETSEIFTDLSPLPGFSIESLEQAFQQLKTCIKQSVSPSLPSVDLAINQARYQMNLNDSIGDPFNSSNVTASSPVPVCHLISLGEPVQLGAENYQCFKLKLIPNEIQQNVARVNQLIEQISRNSLPLSSVKIRLDASGQWSEDQLFQLFDQIDSSKIDYIEDPYADAEDYEDWHLKFNIPFAWDDMASRITELDQLPKGLSALVVKPMMIGLTKTLNIIQLARQNHVSLVLSSLYESSINLNFYARLAKEHKLNCPQGLDTAKYWQQDLITQGVLSVPKKPLITFSNMNNLGSLL